jgi:hypothetical protein
MSIQRVVNLAESITFNRRRIVGIQYSRNEIAYVSETPGRNPWRLTVKVSAPIRYDSGRSIIEALDKSDRSDVEQIYFSNNPGLSYLCGYQGTMNATQRAAITVASFSGTTLSLTNLPTVGGASFPNALLFKAGDMIQLDDKPFPFTVVNDIPRTSGESVAVTVHRPNFMSGNLVGKTLNYGSDCRFQVICTNMPTYTITSGGGGAVINFDSDFELYEYTATEA